MRCPCKNDFLSQRTFFGGSIEYFVFYWETKGLEMSGYGEGFDAWSRGRSVDLSVGREES